MSKHSKTFKNKEDFRKANLAMSAFQIRHNILRKDYGLLLQMTDEHTNQKEKFDTLYRASIKGFLSLIESDIFGLNHIDKYDGYEDTKPFEVKFKQTFKQICKTWNKDEIIKEYLDSKYGLLKEIKNKRDKLIHPKNKEDIVTASIKDFNELKRAFSEYTSMIHSIMKNLFINVEVKDVKEIIELFKN